MAKAITMPALSPSMTDGTLVKWLKREGDTIKSGDIIAEVETDKATMDLESFDSGTILKILALEGTRVDVNGRIAVIGQAGEAIDEALLSQPAPQAPAPVEEKKADLPSAPVAPVAATHHSHAGRVKASPLAKKIAKERGVSLVGVTGTGPSGRILRRDVENLSAGGGTVASIFGSGLIAPDQRVPLTTMRRTIAKRLLESKTQIPHFYVEMEVDAEPLMQARTSINQISEKLPKPVKLSVNDFVLKACAMGLRRVPAVNASFEGDAIRQHGAVHVAFAVAIKDGLITPVVRDAHIKSIFSIAQDAKVLASRAKEGDLKPEEYTGGTFTVSNLGMMGVDRFSAIINPPQAAILAVGAVIKKAVVNSHDQIVVGQRMSLTLSADHRVVDGSTAAEFLGEVKKFLENPSLMFV